MTSYPLDDVDAAIVAIVAVEAFHELPWDRMTYEQRQGAVLAIDVMFTKAEPLLRVNPDTLPVLEGIAKIRDTAKALRDGLPRVS